MRLTIPQHRVTLSGNSTSAGAGYVLVSSGTMTMAGGNNVTLSQNGNAVTISAGSQTVQTQNAVDVTLSGNTSGALALISSGTMTLAGGNNITLSQAGNAVTISGAAAGGAQTAISGIANSETTYTSGTVSLSELGAITIRSTTGNQFQFSVNAQSVQPETQTFVGGISASDTLYTSGTVRITGVGGGVTVSTNTGQRIDISVAAQSVQPETQTFLGGLGNSETTYTSGTVNLSVVAGNLTIRSTTGQAFQFSMSQTVQPETQTAISGIANSQTTYTSGTVSLSELGAITIRSTTGNQFQFSVNSQTAQTGISGIANSQTTYTSGTVSLSELGAITIRSTTGNQFQFSVNSQSVQVETQTAISGIANSQTTYTSGTVSLSELGAITIRSTTGNQYQFSVNSQTVQTQNVVDVTLSGNTAGVLALISSGTMTLAGGNNVTLSQAGNAVTISAAAGGGGDFSAGVSNLGNTAGATGITGTRLVLVGSGDITLSQTTDANGGTVTLNQPYLTGWNPFTLAGPRRTGAPNNATLQIQPWPVPRGYVHDRAAIMLNYSQATNSTLTVTLSAWFGLYTQNVSTLSLLHSSSGTFSINGSGTDSSGQNSGNRVVTYPWTSTIQASNYWLGFISRSTTAGNNASLSGIGISNQNSAFSGLMGVAAPASAQLFLGLGSYSETTAALPAAVAFSEITGSGSINHIIPVVYFMSNSA